MYADKYKLLYVDPPWKFSNKKTGGSMKSGADAQYPTMSLEEMKLMDIDAITDKDCLLVMWWVGSQPQEALDLCEAWGFTVKNMNGFVWHKLTVAQGLPFFGMGFWTRAGSESAIIAVKGKPQRFQAGVRAVRSAKVGVHSAKPDEFRNDCVKLAGDVPRLEMFARKPSAGWDVFGNEAPGTIEIDIKGQCKDCKSMKGHKVTCPYIERTQQKLVSVTLCNSCHIQRMRATNHD
ncbi:DNA methyltransferase [Vibrio phage D164]